jgi:hypothetical protein
VNLKEALARGKLKQFAKEHENKDPHPQGKERFDALMDAMAKGRSAPEPTKPPQGHKRTP